MHTHINCMCINKIQVMFGGSCINVKVESVKSSEIQLLHLHAALHTYITSISFMLINFTHVCTTVEICLNSKGLFTWRWGTPGKGNKLLSGVNCLSIKSLIWSPYLSCKPDQIQIQFPHLRLTPGLTCLPFMGRLPNLSGLAHPRGVPYVHVNSS